MGMPQSRLHAHIHVHVQTHVHTFTRTCACINPCACPCPCLSHTSSIGIDLDTDPSSTHQPRCTSTLSSSPTHPPLIYTHRHLAPHSSNPPRSFAPSTKGQVCTLTRGSVHGYTACTVPWPCTCAWTDVCERVDACACVAMCCTQGGVDGIHSGRETELRNNVTGRNLAAMSHSMKRNSR